MKTRWFAVAGCVLLGDGALAQVTDAHVALKAGDPLPGSSMTVSGIEGVAVNDAGAWVAQVASGGTSVVVSATAEIARIGDALAPGASTISGFRSLALRDDGSLVWMLDVTGAGTNRGAYAGLSPLLVQGDACTAYAGQNIADLGPALVANQVGQFLVFPKLDASPTLTRLIRVTTAGGVVTSQVDLAPMGTSLPGGQTPVSIAGMPDTVIGTEYDLNGSGVAIYTFLASLTPAVTVGIAVGSTPVARVGWTPPSEVGSSLWSSLGERPAVLNDHGDFAFRGATQNITFPETEVLVRNVGGTWSLVAKRLQVLPATGQTVTEFGRRIFIAANGDVVWAGVSGGKAGVYVNSDTVLVQEQDTLDGYTIDTLDIHSDKGMDVSDDGLTIAIAAGSTVDGDALILLQRRFPSFCDGPDLAACPCAPGAEDSGCDTPQATGGVRLDVLSQATSPNAATMTGTGFPGMASPAAIVLRAPALDALSPIVFGDGLRCVGNSGLTRLAAVAASGGVSTHAFGHGAMAGPGTYYYQLWFRSTPGSYCTPDAFNLSNGRVLQW